MTPAELAAECVKAINGGRQHVILTGQKTLFPKGRGPRPIELLCDLGNRKTWLYDAQNVLAALAANGLVEVSFERRQQ
jgi:hypothetical protein